MLLTHFKQFGQGENVEKFLDNFYKAMFTLSDLKIDPLQPSAAVWGQLTEIKIKANAKISNNFLRKFSKIEDKIVCSYFTPRRAKPKRRSDGKFHEEDK